MKKLIVLPLLLISFSSFAEDVTAQFSKCATTDDDKARLACYDKIRDDIVAANKKPKSATGYDAVQISDLKVDIKELVGRKISVASYVQNFADTTFLKNDVMDSSPVMANIEKLPRDDRKKIINQCDTGDCVGIFYGVVKSTPLGYTFFVDKVEWN